MIYYIYTHINQNIKQLVMVFETYTTYDYSVYTNHRDYDVKPSPSSHHDIYYQRMQERPTNPVNAMGSITRNSSGEAYYEFVYSPMLPKTTKQVVKEISVFDYLKKWLCCS